MNPGIQPTHNSEPTAAGLGMIPAAIAKPIAWLGRLAPIGPGRRQTLNLMLLAVVLPVLLLGLALANFLSSLEPFSGGAGPFTQQIDSALERVLEAQATALASIANDPVISSAPSEGDSIASRLEQFHRAHSEFESLALVNSGGEVKATAGILHQDFYLWQNTPAFHDSLNNRSRSTISPLKLGSLTVAQDGSVDLTPSRIERLIFTARASGDPEGHTNSLVVGIMKSGFLVETAYGLLRHNPEEAADGHVSLAIPQESLIPDRKDSNIQLLSLSRGVIEEPGLDSARRGALLGGLRNSTTITPFRETDSSWYSIFSTSNTQQTGRLAVDGLTMGLAAAAVALMLLAGWIIIRSPGNLQLQVSLNPTGHLQAGEGASSATTSASSQEISQRLVAAQESVRRQMADYLHGHVQSKLLALSMALRTCEELVTNDPVRARQMMDEIQGELRKVQDEDLRQVSHELYPAIVKMGLIPAMRSLTSRFNESLDIDLIIDADVFALDSDGEAGLPEKQRLGVYRIAEEALNNILKHAKANQVEIALICQGRSSLIMSVVDDGCGFNLDEHDDSQGLALITDYAEAIAGNAQIDSVPERGTTVKLSVSIDNPASD